MTVLLSDNQQATFHEVINGSAHGSTGASRALPKQAVGEPFTGPLPPKSFPDNNSQHPKFRIAQMRHDAVEKDIGKGSEPTGLHRLVGRSYALWRR